MLINHICLIAPSYTLSEEDVQLTKSHFESLGMRITVPSDLLGEDLLCANKDVTRLAHLKEALNDHPIDAIWLIQGGYGLTPLIPQLFQVAKPEKEKLFIGFSDGTALHVFLNQVWNVPTLHAPCALQIAKKRVGFQTINATLNILKTGFSDYLPPLLKPLNKQAKDMSSLTGALIGGNLSILQTSLGTNWQLNPSGKILFLEDLDERGYSVDRLLVHLKQAQILKEVKAIIFGAFIGGEEANGSSLVFPVIQRFAENINLPVYHLPDCDHGNENFPLPFNIDLKFTVE